MLKITIPKEVKDELLRPLRISSGVVSDVIANRNDFERLKLPGKLELQFFLKSAVSDATYGFTLVVARVVNTTLEVSLAVRVPRVFRDAAPLLTPLRMLEQFVNRFGLFVQVGDQIGKFFLNQRIPLSPEAPTPLPFVIDPSPGVFQTMLIGPQETYGDKFIDCILCFAIRLEPYFQEVTAPQRPFTLVNHKMQLTVGKGAKHWLKLSKTSIDRISCTINDRHLERVARSIPIQIYCMHWFDDGEVVLVIGEIRDFDVASDQVRIDSVDISCILSLKDQMPTGKVDKKITLEENLRVIAENFGVPLSCDSTQTMSKFYTGSWDGKQPTIIPLNPFKVFFLLQAHVDESGIKLVDFAFALAPELYFNWLRDKGRI